MNALPPHEKTSWVLLLQAMADDEWIVAHRGSEWLGLAPDLEEDLAYSSVNQDEMGHAQFYYALLTELGEREPEQMVFARTASQWRNACILESPNGDWARVVALRYFYEVFDDIRTNALTRAPWPSLQAGVRKIRREEAYHLEHFATWFDMLANGTLESRRRLLDAILDMWPKLGDIFSWGEPDTFLSTLDLASLRQDEVQRLWEERIRDKLHRWQIAWPGSVPLPAANGRRGEHSDDLANLLGVMSEVWRSDETALW